MDQNATAVRTSALRLSTEDRAQIAADLIESLDLDALSAEDPAAVEAAWQDEIGRRIEAVERGEVELLDGTPILNQLRAGQRR